jgi:tetratricopeptide (TPR) repeat protein
MAFTMSRCEAISILPWEVVGDPQPDTIDWIFASTPYRDADRETFGELYPPCRCGDLPHPTSANRVDRLFNRTLFFIVIFERLMNLPPISRVILFVIACSVQAFAGDEDSCPYFGDPKKSIENCTAVIDSASTSKDDRSSAYHDRGVAFRHDSRLDEAIADFNMAEKLGDDSIGIYFDRGGSYFDIGRYMLALADYTTGIETVVKPYVKQARRSKRKLDPIRKDIFSRLYAERGKVNYILGQYDEADADFNAAKALDSSNAEIMAIRCVGRAYAKKFDQALKDCDSALGNPRNGVYAGVEFGSTTAGYGRALVRMARKDYASAVQDLKAVLKQTPDDMAALYCLGLAKKGLGDKTGEEDIANATKRQPSLAMTYRLIDRTVQ